MMAVPVKATEGAKPSFEPGTPQPLFDTHIVGGLVELQYDVTADGKRFLVNTTVASDAKTAPPLNVVVNWNAGKR